MPDHDEVDDKSKVQPHPFLTLYWGDVDNENVIHLFTKPSEDYSPIKLLSLDVMFKDHDEGNQLITDRQFRSSYQMICFCK